VKTRGRLGHRGTLTGQLYFVAKECAESKNGECRIEKERPQVANNGLPRAEANQKEADLEPMAGGERYPDCGRGRRSTWDEYAVATGAIPSHCRCRALAADSAFRLRCGWRCAVDGGPWWTGDFGLRTQDSGLDSSPAPCASLAQTHIRAQRLHSEARKAKNAGNHTISCVSPPAFTPICSVLWAAEFRFPKKRPQPGVETPSVHRPDKRPGGPKPALRLKVMAVRDLRSRPSA
jgi:hypothetical protein